MSTSTTYTVQGMHCSSCAMKVSGAVSDVDGVNGADVDVETGKLTVSGETFDDAAIRTAIDAAGYQLA